LRPQRDCQENAENKMPKHNHLARSY
jgi:hypothetical protein